MTLIAILVATGLGGVVGFGLGRMKSWVASHEQKKTIDADSPLLKTRLRVKGIVRHNAKV